MKVNPDEMGNYFEGDIMLSKNVIRNVIRNEYYRWPGDIMALCVYQFYQTSQCIRFTPRTNHNDYILVLKNNTGCWSSVGRQGGAQIVNLQENGCVYKGIVMHELTHAVGF
ncbi:LOW QUALITY PROTEIN: astacin-like [Pogonomyrmex barbatus]|uniref:Metalloendopeptidase n=1 Tax=Pogonomyrmex barbatus TaxID=144034 RepID=A0A8N1S5J2_9HYME|nr:LOW QUALITY PROTEIN: astacin-like [Pogonomyrmex barbatus]